MGIRLVSEGGLLNNRIVKENPLVLDSFLETNDTPARYGDPAEFYEDDSFNSEVKFVRSSSPISATDTDGTAGSSYEDTVLYSGVGALGRFDINTISTTGGIQKSGASAADQVAVWVGTGNLVRSRSMLINSAGTITIIGLIIAGSGPTTLTTAAGLLRHQAIDPNIAGSGLSISSGVLSVDSHAPAAHTIASHSDTGATGAELETLTNGNNADSLHTHAVGGAPIDWANPGTIGSSTSNTGAFTTLDTSGNLSVTGTSSVVNATGSALFVLDRPDVTPTDNQIIGEFRFTSLNDAAQNGNMGGLKMVFTDVSSNSERTTLEFYTNSNISNKRMTLNAAGDLEVIDGDLIVTAGDFEVTAGTVGIGVAPTGDGLSVSHTNAGTSAAVFIKGITASSAPTVGIAQLSATGAVPALSLTQVDVSEGVMNYTASDRGVIASSLSSLESVRVELNGVVRRIALYVDV